VIQATVLTNRGVVCLSGQDKTTFLQGLVTNDVTGITQQNPVYAALLSPQGKFQYDLFIGAIPQEPGDDVWMIDCDCGAGNDQVNLFVKKLSLYKLRSQIMLENVSETWAIMALWHPDSLKIDLSLIRQEFPEGVLAFADPRLPQLGVRLFVLRHRIRHIYNSLMIKEASFDDYDTHRIKHGVPDGSRDMLPDKAIPLECGLDELNAIDWNKGCYLGQELTARTHYRGLIRKRLVPVEINGYLPSFQTPVVQDGEEMGSMRTVAGKWGLALLRLESLKSSLPLYAGQTLVKPYVPGWMRLGDEGGHPV
jgi:folate-binding protein YgfZ